VGILSGRTHGRNGCATAPGNGAKPSLSILIDAVEQEVIPRLLDVNLQQDRSATTAGEQPDAIGAREVADFTDVVLAREGPAILAYVNGLCMQGVALESIFLDLLAPTARRLGEFWEEDLCDFTEVTLAMCRLHQLLRELSPEFGRTASYRDSEQRQILLVPVPGEQHMFGLSVVAEFLCHAGWNVFSDPATTTRTLTSAVHADWYSIVGFSVSTDSRLDELRSDIRATRSASQNPAVGILVGGRVFVEHPEYAAEVGADAMATDARQAALQSENLLSLKGRQR
jgi:methanogenic corrinoid protein MtbC1